MEYGYAVEGQRGSGQHGAHQRQSIQQASFTYKRHFLIPEVRLPVDPVKVFEIITKPSMFAYYHYSRELEASFFIQAYEATLSIANSCLMRKRNYQTPVSMTRHQDRQEISLMLAGSDS